MQASCHSPFLRWFKRNVLSLPTWKRYLPTQRHHSVTNFTTPYLSQSGLWGNRFPVSCSSSSKRFIRPRENLNEVTQRVKHFLSPDLRNRRLAFDHVWIYDHQIGRQICVYYSLCHIFLPLFGLGCQKTASNEHKTSQNKMLNLTVMIRHKYEICHVPACVVPNLFV